jgi:hypothetical protein
MPFQEALRMAYANQIEDGKTLIGLMWAEQRIGRAK